MACSHCRDKREMFNVITSYGGTSARTCIRSDGPDMFLDVEFDDELVARSEILFCPWCGERLNPAKGGNRMLQFVIGLLLGGAVGFVTAALIAGGGAGNDA